VRGRERWRGGEEEKRVKREEETRDIVKF